MATVKQAHGGTGSASHMACLLFTSQLGLKPKLIPYRGAGPALSDLIGDHVDFFCEQVVSVAPEVKENLIKAYVVSGNAHSSALPNVPSAKQVGIPKFQLSTWGANFAPKGTPKDVVAKLSGALDKALDDPAVAKRFVDQGGSRPDAFCKDAQGAQSLGRISATSTRRPSRADRMPARMTASEVVA